MVRLSCRLILLGRSDAAKNVELLEEVPAAATGP
jgi:hypothetical protein